MVTVDVSEKTYTVEEYLALDRKSAIKHNYYNGKIEPLSGGTANHNEIAARIAAALIFAIDEQDKPYHVYNSDMRIQIPQQNFFVYPDAVVVCEKPEFFNNRKDILTNPLLVVEVLSPSTEDYDKRLKFFHYRTLPSFKEYVLASQERASVSSFYQEKPKHWVETIAEGTEQVIYFPSIDCEISLQKIYKGISF